MIAYFFAWESVRYIWDTPENFAKLDIGYVDMMLLHHPGANDVKAYKAMEEYVSQGKIRCFQSPHADTLCRWRSQTGAFPRS